MLTKQQKLEAYTFAMFWELHELDMLKEGERTYRYWGICEALASFFNSDFEKWRFPAHMAITDLPEFYKQKPELNQEKSFWWHEYSPLRLKAIERAIELTEKL